MFDVQYPGARCSSVVERSFVVRWVVGSIPHGGPTELFLIPPSAQRLVKQRPWYVISCLCDVAYKEPLLLIEIAHKRWQVVLSHRVVLYHMSNAI